MTKKKKYEMVEYQGQQLRRYEDGSIRDEHGHIKTQSRERAQMIRQGKETSMMLLADDAIKEYTKLETADEGVKALLKKRLDVAFNDKGRAGNDWARWFLQMSGYFNPGRIVEVNKTNIQNNFELPKEYLDALAQLRREGVIEGETNDDEE